MRPAPERDEHDDADADADRRRPRPPGDEALDERGEQERGDESDEHVAGASRLVRERDATRAVAGVDQRPADPQPGRAGDDHGGQLEQPVGQDQPPELAALADVREQAAGHADVGAVVGEERGGDDAEEDPGREREEARRGRC